MDSAVFKQMDSERSALLLQQIRIPARNTGVMLACVAECAKKGLAGDFCEEAVDFFREHFFQKDFGAQLYSFTMDFAERYEKSIGQRAGRACAQNAFSFAAALFSDDKMMIFGTGSSRIFIVSRFLLKPRVRVMEFVRGDVRECILDDEAGILIATEGAWRSWKQEEIGRFFFREEHPEMDTQRSSLERRLEEFCLRAGEGGKRTVYACGDGLAANTGQVGEFAAIALINQGCL